MFLLIEWRWDFYQFSSMISSFFRNLVNISRSFSHFGIFIANKEEKIHQLTLRILTKKKKLSNRTSRSARSRHCCAIPVLLCFSNIFLHFKKIFISRVWEVNNCTASLLESSLWFETAVGQFEAS